MSDAMHYPGFMAAGAAGHANCDLTVGPDLADEEGQGGSHARHGADDHDERKILPIDLSPFLLHPLLLLQAHCQDALEQDLVPADGRRSGLSGRLSGLSGLSGLG